MARTSQSMRTPLSRVLGLGSAKSGTEHFWRQRVTGIANFVLLTALMVIVIALVGRPQDEVLAALASPFVAVLLLAGLISALYHMHLGMQVVIEDYVHGEAAKTLLVLGNIFFPVAVGFLAVFAVLKLSFGA